MRIRYHNITKKITALPAPDWIESDQEQTVVEIADSVRLPSDLSAVRFGSVKSPFVPLSDDELNKINEERQGKAVLKARVLEILKVNPADAESFIKGLKEIINEPSGA